MTHSHATRHSIFQTSLITALAQGVYEDEMSLAELLGHGSFGIGTFNALDGEMVILDGTCYRLRGDGTVTLPQISEHTPYAVVTNFVPHISHRVEQPLTRGEASILIDSLLPSSNYMYALKISGQFSWVTTRTVVKQERPFRPLVQATDGEQIVRFDDFAGTVAGFRTPLFEQGISVAGCHVHAIDDEHTRGGHLVDFAMESGLIEICLGTDLNLRLPLTPEFRAADLAAEDLQDDVRKAEHH